MLDLKNIPVLIVEDSDDDFEILEGCLRSSGVENRLVRCRTGKEVERYLSEFPLLPTRERPVMIFLDLNIPGGDGRNILRQLRQNPEISLIPIIILTTSAQPEDIETCYRSGASGYLVKPLDLDTFELKVRQLCDYWLRCVQLPVVARSSL